MELRQLQLRLPSVLESDLRETLDRTEVLEYWSEPAMERQVSFDVLVASSKAESVIRALEERFGRTEGFRIVLMGVEATIPRFREEDEVAQGDDEAETGEKASAETSGDEAEDDEDVPPVNIEELYADVTSGVEFSATYAAMVSLSAIVAAVGLVRDDVTIVIAAMIIAPLLGPNIALSLAATLGDLDLAKRSIWVNALGFAVAFVISLVFGWVVPFDPSADQIANRTQFGILEIILAGGAGAAGALSFTTGRAGQVVGVMVAVALVPPAVSFGMLLGGGFTFRAIGALYLLAVNLITVNLAGVLTFWVQRIRPRVAWEAGRARRSLWIAVATWTVLLTALALLLVFGEVYRRFP
jgi:uncharacterized hydrophobic protein (TIGR00341 family)